MKTLSVIACFLGLSLGAAAQDSPAADTIGRVSVSARDALDKSVQQLSQLRDQIEAEKLPLARELTAQEDQLAQLRRDHDKVTRLLDAGNLELPTIKAEMKARQDEQSYIGNLLDEYARTFEGKVNISELQYCGEAIEDAKHAAEDATLAPAERFERQLAFTDVSIKRLFDAMGGMRFPGVGVDTQGSVVNGQFAVIGPVALFCATTGAAGLVVPQTGSPNPLIRPLEGAMQAGIGNLVQSGEGLMPFDPSRGGALKELVQKTSLIRIFEKGGPIMWPLLICSILSLGTVIERVVFLLGKARKFDSKAMEQFFEAVEQGDAERAVRVGNESRYYVVNTLAYALEHRQKSLSNALLFAQEQELKKFRRGIPILDTVITLAPLLGLLGTVTGMMGSFSLIGGDLSAPGAITGGIAEALIATAFGLGIAITSLIPFNILNTKMEQARAEIDSASTQLELLVHPQPVPIEVLAHASHPGHTGHAGFSGHLVGKG